MPTLATAWYVQSTRKGDLHPRSRVPCRDAADASLLTKLSPPVHRQLLYVCTLGQGSICNTLPVPELARCCSAAGRISQMGERGWHYGGQVEGQMWCVHDCHEWRRWRCHTPNSPSLKDDQPDYVTTCVGRYNAHMLTTSTKCGHSTEWDDQAGVGGSTSSGVLSTKWTLLQFGTSWLALVEVPHLGATQRRHHQCVCALDDGKPSSQPISASLDWSLCMICVMATHPALSVWWPQIPRSLCDGHTSRVHLMPAAVDNLIIERVIMDDIVVGHLLVKFADWYARRFNWRGNGAEQHECHT